MWLFYLLGRTFDQSQTLWLHLCTNSRSATRRPFVVQQIDLGNGFTTFIATPVIGVEKVGRYSFCSALGYFYWAAITKLEGNSLSDLRGSFFVVRYTQYVL